MRNRIKYIIIILFSLIIFDVKAVPMCGHIDAWIDGKAYCNGDVIIDDWAYDNTTKKYVLIDRNGYKVREVDDIYNDPEVKKGKLKISAIIPDNLKDMNIYINVQSGIYDYTFELNKDNNFTIENEMNEEVYFVYYDISNVDGEFENQLPNQIKIREGETTSYNIDYSKYKTKKKKEQSKVKKIIVIAAISGIVLAFIIIILMFLKARSI